MSIFIFSLNEVHYNLMIRTGAIFVRASDRVWASKITSDDKILIYREEIGVVQGVFKRFNSIIDVYFKNIMNSRTQLLCYLDSDIIMGISVNRNYENGILSSRDGNGLINSLSWDPQMFVINENSSITGSHTLDGLIWGCGRIHKRGPIILDLNNLPDSMVKKYVELIQKLKIKYVTQEKNNIIHLYDLKLPSDFKIGNGSVESINNSEFMDSLVCSLVSVEKNKLFISDTIPFDLRYNINLKTTCPNIRKYLESRGCITILEYDRRLRVSPLSISKHPFSQVLKFHQRDLELLDSFYSSIDNRISSHPLLNFDQRNEMILLLLQKLFLYHDYQILNVTRETAWITYMDMLHMNVKYRLVIITHNNINIEEINYIKIKSEIDDIKIVKLLFLTDETIKSISISDYRGLSDANYVNLQNDVTFNLNIDFTSVFINSIIKIINNFSNENLNLRIEENNLDQIVGKTNERIIDDVDNMAPIVDFTNPEKCIGTKPVKCLLYGKLIHLDNKDWSELFVIIIEELISEFGQKIDQIDESSFYDSNPIFSNHNHGPFCVKLSNGKWINTDYDTVKIINILEKIFNHLGMALSGVAISYTSDSQLDNATRIRYIENDKNSKNIKSSHINNKNSLESAEIIKKVMIAKFPYGFINDGIELEHFRCHALNLLGITISCSDEQLFELIKINGFLSKGKVFYIENDKIKDIIKKIDELLKDGLKIIYYVPLYNKFENWLNSMNVISDDLLQQILIKNYPIDWQGMDFLSPVYKYHNETDIVIEEITRAWGDIIKLSEEEIMSKVPFIDQTIVETVLKRDDYFIKIGSRVYIKTSNIVLLDTEISTILEFVEISCKQYGYVSINKIPVMNIYNRYFELSVEEIQILVYEKILKNDYYKNNRLISIKGTRIDTFEIMKDFCLEKDECSLNDIELHIQNIIGHKNYNIGLEAAYSILVRTDRDNFVADKYVLFDIDEIDKALELVLLNEYAPIKSITSFAIFPPCGFVWNHYILESYCLRFSKMFKLNRLSVNSSNIGVITKRTCQMSYFDILVDAVSKSKIPLEKEEILHYLFELGYIGKRRFNDINSLIFKVNEIRNRRSEFVHF